MVAVVALYRRASGVRSLVAGLTFATKDRSWRAPLTSFSVVIVFRGLPYRTYLMHGIQLFEFGLIGILKHLENTHTNGHTSEDCSYFVSSREELSRTEKAQSSSQFIQTLLVPVSWGRGTAQVGVERCINQPGTGRTSEHTGSICTFS